MSLPFKNKSYARRTEVSFSSSNEHPRNSSVQNATQKCYKQTPKLKQDKSETSGVHTIILPEKLKNNNQIFPPWTGASSLYI